MRRQDCKSLKIWRGTTELETRGLCRDTQAPFSNGPPARLTGGHWFDPGHIHQPPQNQPLKRAFLATWAILEIWEQ